MKLEKNSYYYFVANGNGDLDGEYEGKYVGQNYDESPDGNGELVYFFEVGQPTRLMVYPWELKHIEMI